MAVGNRACGLVLDVGGSPMRGRPGLGSTGAEFAEEARERGVIVP